MDKIDKKNAVLNPRVSSLRQVKSGDSIQAQEQRLKKFCDDNNLNILKIIPDLGKSASLKKENYSVNFDGRFLKISFDLSKRDGLRQIMAMAKKREFDVLCFYKWDRFSRSVAFAEASQIYFNQYGVSLIPSNDSIDPFASSIMRALGQEEVRKIKERVRFTRLNQFSKGIIVGRCPIGYLPIFKNKRDRRGIIGIKPDPKKIGMIKDIFFLTSEGKSYKEICEKWKLKPQSYYNIIKNKVYMGVISFENKERKGIHEPLISQEIFDKCQNKKSTQNN